MTVQRGVARGGSTLAAAAAAPPAFIGISTTPSVVPMPGSARPRPWFPRTRLWRGERTIARRIGSFATVSGRSRKPMRAYRLESGRRRDGLIVMGGEDCPDW